MSVWRSNIHTACGMAAQSTMVEPYARGLYVICDLLLIRANFQSCRTSKGDGI